MKKVASKKKPAPEGTPIFDYIDELQRRETSKPKVSNSRPHFPGPAFNPELDGVRLSRLQYLVFDLMKDGKFRTHSEIKAIINQGSENGIAAMLRNLRHGSRGKHTVNKNRRGDPKSGLWEYQLIVNPKAKVTKAKEN